MKIYPLHEIVIPLISFIIGYAILYIVFSVFSTKFRNLQLRYKMALTAGLSHFILTTYLCVIVAIAIEREPLAGMIFFYCRFVDFPFFLMVSSLDNLLRPLIGYNAVSVVAPFISFSILGSIAYMCLALILGRLIEMAREK